MYKIFPITLSLTLLSCKTNNYHDQMRECIKENYIIIKKDMGFSKLENSNLNEDFDIFNSIKKFENLLIDAELLNSKTKKDYKLLIGQEINFSTKKVIYDNTKLYNPYFYSLHRNSFVYNNIFYASCPYNIVITKQGSIDYYPTKAVFEKFISEGYPSNEILLELLNVTDFKDETSRLLLCNLLFENWYKGYER